MAQSSADNRDTVLLVEDDPALRRQVKRILEAAGFIVLPADSAKEAVRLELEFPGTIDLLLSDVKLAGTSGPKLAKRLKERRPRMRVVLMAGYPDGALLVLNYGWHYIEKPLVAEVLVGKLKDVLRGETREQTTDRFDSLKTPRKTLGRASFERQPGAIRQLRLRA